MPIVYTENDRDFVVNALKAIVGDNNYIAKTAEAMGMEDVGSLHMFMNYPGSRTRDWLETELVKKLSDKFPDKKSDIGELSDRVYFIVSSAAKMAGKSNKTYMTEDQIKKKFGSTVFEIRTLLKFTKEEVTKGEVKNPGLSEEQTQKEERCKDDLARKEFCKNLRIPFLQKPELFGRIEGGDPALAPNIIRTAAAEIERYCETQYPRDGTDKVLLKKKILNLRRCAQMLPR